MPRSPPLFICSSPGPDPYRSHDNVYEELEHPRDTDSEPPVQSDDDFAEDELSLPGDRSFHKSSSDGGTTVATIYHDRSASSNGGTSTDQYMERNRTERNSLLSSSSSGNDNNLRQSAGAGAGAGVAGPSNGSVVSGAGVAGGSSSTSSHNNRNSNSSSECASSASGNNNNPNGCVNGSNISSTSTSNNNNSNSSGTNNNSIGGLFRSRKQQPSTLGSGRGNKHLNNLNSLVEPSSEVSHTLPAGCDERAMMTLPPSYQAAAAASRTSPNNLNSINNNSFVNSNSLNNNSSRGNYYSTIDDECDPVERRNRINAQLSASAAAINNGGPGVSTIFRNMRPPQYPGNNHNHHNHQTTNASSRSRTNPRSLDRRRYLINNNNNNNHSPGSNLAVISSQDPSQYIYHEPVFHEGLIYDACLSYSDRSSGGSAGPPYPYVLPQFTTFRNHHGQQQAIYSRDSSFGSDSGYSQHTQASNRSVGWSRNRPPQPTPHQLNPPEQQPTVTDS